MGSKEQDVGQLKTLEGQLVAEFTDPRDELRVEQAVGALRTAQMAISHLHDERQNRRDLVGAHEAEAKANGRYAEERKRNPDMYANHYPDPAHDRPSAVEAEVVA